MKMNESSRTPGLVDLLFLGDEVLAHKQRDGDLLIAGRHERLRDHPIIVSRCGLRRDESAEQNGCPQGDAAS
jgi:hypothetical protein